MERSITESNAPSAGNIGRTVRDAFAEVAKLLFGSATFEPRSSIELEVRELVEPHLAVLIHKRVRFLTPDATGVVHSDRWTAEIDSFVDRCFFWPAPASSEPHSKLNRRQLVKLVDRIVVGEQHKRGAERGSLPATSRFDSYWAD